MSTPPAPPSAATPLRPLPSQRTQVAPYGWLRRHLGGVAAVAPLLSGAAAWAAGVVGGVDPVKAFQQLGVPVATMVLMASALAWTYLVYIPGLGAVAEKTRQLLLDAQSAEITQIVQSHAEDRAAWLSTQQEQSALLRELAQESRALATRMARLEDALQNEPTHPAAPAAAGLRPLGGRRA